MTLEATTPAAPARPRITVFVTNYNYEQYVGRAIESALAQTYDGVSVIVVDDGSRDKSVEVIRGYPVELLCKENGGQVSAVAHGVDHLSGDVVIFLDSDDYLYPNACEEIAKVYRPGVSLIQYKLDKVRDGEVIGSYPDYPFMASNHKENVLKHGFIHTSPTSGNAFSVDHIRRMMARLDLGGQKMNGVDGYIIFGAPFTGEVVSIDLALGAYNIHGNNISLSAGKTFQSATNSIVVSIWQRTGYLSMQDESLGRDELHRLATMNLAANQYRNAFLLRRGYGSDILDNIGSLDLVVKSFTRFLEFPRMSLEKRVLNAGAVALLFLAPPSLCRKIIPRK
jgi:glycosyltransferase involved in cell wall biosynthesis